MAKDVITRFKLETTQYDSKLRDAAKGLAEYSRTATNAGKEFDKFTKSNVDAARALGSTATSTQNAKDQVKELVGAFNDAAKAYNNLTREQQQSDFGKALSASLQQLQQRIRETKQEMQSLGDSTKGMGGLFGGDKLSGMLQVFGGNVMTKLASAGMSLVGEIGDAIQASSQLAREAEGVRIAFDRLDDPTLLDALKEATHGTVSEFELMKAAVKFKDFKLPLEELGSMLAFAQQKAKDTGQSVDYMVNSIVNGLGRKSKLILDNLGISAAEIDEKMKATGDMTKAVGQIIREQMASAGSYVETAADRSARATADLQNKMLELGRTFQPIQEAGVSMFNSMKMAAIDALNGMRPFFDMFTEAGRIRQQREGQGGDSKVNQQLSKLKVARAAGSSYYVRSSYNSTVKDYQKQISDLDFKIAAFGKPKDSIDKGALQRLKEQREAVNQLLNEYKEGAKQYLNPSSGKSDGTTTPTNPVKLPKGSHTETPQEKAAERMRAAQHKYAVALEKAQADFDKGNITEKDLKTAQRRAAESLFEAADDAYRTYADPQYKTVREDAKQKFVNLGGEIKTLTEIEKANQKTAREQEQAQKKLSDAQKKRADALESGDLRGYLSAGKELRKLGGASVMEDIDRQDAEIPLNFTFTESNLNAFIESLKERLSNAGVGTELASGLSAQLGDATALSTMLGTANKAGLDPAQLGLTSMFKQLFNMTPGDYVSDGEMKNTSKRVRKEAQKRGKSDDQKDTTFVEAFGKLNNGVTSMVGSLEQMGIQIPEGFRGVLSGISGAIGVLQAIMVIVEAIEAMQTVGTFLGIFAKGGIVPHAAKGYYVPGNRPSGDTTLIRANAGELILNRAAQGNLASQLEGGAGLGDLNLSAVIRGEQIRLVLNNNGRRTGRGEYVQSKSVK